MACLLRLIFILFNMAILEMSFVALVLYYHCATAINDIEIILSLGIIVSLKEFI